MKAALIISTLVNLALIAAFVHLFKEKIAQKLIRLTGVAKIAVLGDSQMMGGNWTFLLRQPVLKIGKGGLTSERVALMATKVKGVKYCFIHCGGNDYGKNEISQTVGSIDAIAHILLNKGIKPVFLNILKKHYNPNKNKHIEEINSQIGASCWLWDVGYITTETLFDEYGLKENYTSDGVHLNRKGYKVLSEYISNYLKTQENEQHSSKNIGSVKIPSRN